MVLKKCFPLKRKFFSLTLFVVLTNKCYSQNNDYWQKAIQTAFSNSPDVNEIKLDYNSAIINKKQYDYQWFPQFQVSIQGTTTVADGINYYLLNQESDSSYVHLLSPHLQLALFQKLPGKGSIGLISSYGFNFLAERNVFQQWPQINLNINQTLARGMMGIAGNPESRLINEQMYYSELNYKRKLNLQLYEILSLFQNIDFICSQEKYYLALVQEYDSELKTAYEKEKTGLQSSMESYYTKHQLTEAQSNLKDLQYQKQQCLNELILLIPNFNADVLSNQRNQLSSIINNLYETTNTQLQSLDSNLYSLIYSSVQKQYLYQFQNDETNYAPQLVISSSITPDGNMNAYYSDWYKSFRIFNESPNPLNFTLSIGIQKNFELPGAKKLRNEIYQMNKSSIENQIQFSKQTQEKQLEMLKSQILKDTSYLLELETEIVTEQDFREKRKKLLQQNIITQNEFYQSETTYFKIHSDYIKTFWTIVNNKIAIIDLCSSDFPILTTFLGDLN